VRKTSTPEGRQRRRFANVLVEPGLQLGLPALLLAITFGFAAAQAGHGYLAYGRFYQVVLAETSAPHALQAIIDGQTQSFLVASGAITLAYAIIVLIASVAWAHRMVGPIVAFRRHVEALKNAEYGSRVHIRRFDAFPELARDLNELAELLEAQEKLPR
jgi:methyl-accepting chemotaxis protein